MTAIKMICTEFLQVLDKLVFWKKENTAAVIMNEEDIHLAKAMISVSLEEQKNSQDPKKSVVGRVHEKIGTFRYFIQYFILIFLLQQK